MIKNQNETMKKVGRNMMKVENQRSAKKVPYTLSDGKQVGKSFGSEPSRGANDTGPKTRGGGAAVRGVRSSSKLG